VVILNGPPRSGKSSIIAALQAAADGVWLGLGVDLAQQMLGEQWQPGIGLRPGGERPDLEPMVARLYQGLFGAVAAHSRQGLNVAVDVGLHEDYSTPLGIRRRVAEALSGLPVLVVGVDCPVEVAIQRRRETWGGQGFAGGGAANPDPVQRWHREVHAGLDYDLEVDTSVLSAAGCAERITAHLRAGTGLGLRSLAR